MSCCLGSVSLIDSLSAYSIQFNLFSRLPNTKCKICRISTLKHDQRKQCLSYLVWGLKLKVSRSRQSKGISQAQVNHSLSISKDRLSRRNIKVDEVLSIMLPLVEQMFIFQNGSPLGKLLNGSALLIRIVNQKHLSILLM